MSQLEPVPSLLSRVRAELSAEFDLAKPFSTATAPGRLDVMGGIVEYTGASLVEMAIDRAAATIVQARGDREIQVFSFNQFDEHVPFTWRMPLDRLASCSADELQSGFAQPGARWAADAVGGLFMLHQRKLVDLSAPAVRGLNIAMLNQVPAGVALGSSAAMQVSAARNFAQYFSMKIEPIDIPGICQSIQSELLGTRVSRSHGFASALGEPNSLICMDGESISELKLPAGFRIVAISSGVKQKDVESRNAQTRTAAAMAHAMILAKMREMGRAAGRELERDPMNGLMGNLDQDDYKRFFRSYLPEKMTGAEFITRFGRVIEVEPAGTYFVLGAADHHVLETRRVKQFREFIEQSAALPLEDKNRFILMDKAGHLMYASHLSYMNDARLGSDECDLLVSMVRAREKSGLYGARMTDRGCGGTVAVVGEAGESPDRGIAEIMKAYEDQTGRKSTFWLSPEFGLI